jgi:hypothetical protein
MKRDQILSQHSKYVPKSSIRPLNKVVLKLFKNSRNLGTVICVLCVLYQV